MLTVWYFAILKIDEGRNWKRILREKETGLWKTQRIYIENIYENSAQYIGSTYIVTCYGWVIDSICHFTALALTLFPCLFPVIIIPNHTFFFRLLLCIVRRKCMSNISQSEWTNFLALNIFYTFIGTEFLCVYV